MKTEGGTGEENVGERLRGRMVGKAGKRKAKIQGVKKKAVENNLRVGLHPVKYKHCSKKQITKSFPNMFLSDVYL